MSAPTRESLAADSERQYLPNAGGPGPVGCPAAHVLAVLLGAICFIGWMVIAANNSSAANDCFSFTTACPEDISVELRWYGVISTLLLVAVTEILVTCYFAARKILGVR